jgi:hypothetical protein
MHIFFKKKIFFNIILIFFSFFLTDLIVTSILNKLTDRKKIAIEKIEIYGVQHSKFHHHLKENISIDDLFNNQKYTIKTNSLGFRDKEIREIDYQNIDKRLVLIGDSFTFGVLLNYEDTFAGIIDEHLSRGGGGGRF